MADQREKRQFHGQVSLFHYKKASSITRELIEGNYGNYNI